MSRLQTQDTTVPTTILLEDSSLCIRKNYSLFVQMNKDWEIYEMRIFNDLLPNIVKIIYIIMHIGFAFYLNNKLFL